MTIRLDRSAEGIRIVPAAAVVSLASPPGGRRPFLLRLARSCPTEALLVEAVDEDGAEDDRTLDELDPERLHVAQGQAVVDQADDEHAQERADQAALAAEERGAADDDGGDGVELEPLRGDRLRRIEATGEDDAAMPASVPAMT